MTGLESGPTLALTIISSVTDLNNNGNGRATQGGAITEKATRSSQPTESCHHVQCRHIHPAPISSEVSGLCAVSAQLSVMASWMA